MRTTLDAEASAALLPALLKLQTWLSPAFPVGAFGYSHGLEAAIAEGRIAGADACRGWIETLVRHGSLWNDLVLLGAAHRAAACGDEVELRSLGEFAVALSGCAERRRETLELGAAFTRAAEPWGGSGAEWPYPVAVGALAARHAIPRLLTLSAYAHALAANLLSVAVRLVPLGQGAAVGILHDLEPFLAETAERAEGASPDDLGSASILSDISAMRHETLSTRLFRT
ncbi:urease accessory UreF family protein [Aureimonas sp. ME7]|uniref:urease accessory protein UreF n=1 Tax=Aureimonas sp. ME7 TaxID=2744252 RepID=UPI0015F715C9|nr:urease accessory UreF family protein [Aureimonas sp. ME7]